MANCPPLLSGGTLITSTSGPKTCSTGELQCDSGECIHSFWVCDGDIQTAKTGVMREIVILKLMCIARILAAIFKTYLPFYVFFASRLTRFFSALLFTFLEPSKMTLIPSGAPLHTLSKLYDVPVGFVSSPLLRQCISICTVAKGWLLLDIG